MLIEPFVFRAKEGNIPFEVKIKTSNKHHFFDTDILTKIIVNLLSNAFKYRESNAVSFSSIISDSKLQLKICNFNSQVKESGPAKIL